MYVSNQFTNATWRPAIIRRSINPDEPENPDVDERVERSWNTDDLAMFDEAAAILFFLGRREDANQLVAIVTRQDDKRNACAIMLALATRVASLGSVSVVRELIERCEDVQVRPDYFYLAAIAAREAGHVNASKELFMLGATGNLASRTVI